MPDTMVVRIEAAGARVDPTGASPFQLEYKIQGYDPGLTPLFEFWIYKPSDGTMIDDTAFAAWWDTDVADALRLRGSGPPTWAATKAFLPSDWPY
jgi:hypothetical protein